jgi:hypothetical protein
MIRSRIQNPNTRSPMPRRLQQRPGWGFSLFEIRCHSFVDRPENEGGKEEFLLVLIVPQDVCCEAEKPENKEDGP